MSDPSRPPQQRLTKRQQFMAEAPEVAYQVSDLLVAERARLKKLEEAKSLLGSLRMTPKHSVRLNPQLSCIDHVKAATGPKMATTKAGPGTTRNRSVEAKSVVNAGYRWLPESHQYASRAVVGARMTKYCKFENMGTVMTLGRLAKYAPKSGKVRDLVGVTAEEAAKALDSTGMNFEHLVKEQVVLKTILPTDVPGEAVYVSKHSYNGLPTESDSDDLKALDLCIALAKDISFRIDRIYNEDGAEGIEEWYNAQRITRPYMFTLMGRAKDDVYAIAKYEALECRFYTAFPRPMQIVMQQMSQAMLDHTKSIFDDTDEQPQHNFSGCSLAHDGADRLVQVLQRQLDREGFGCSVCGDDSFVVITFAAGDGTVWTVTMSLDCSSFDLTQVGSVMRPIKREIAKRASLWDGARATLWECFMTNRDIVVDKTLTYETDEMGTSGGIFQDKINSAGMKVCIDRFKADVLEDLRDRDGTIFALRTDPRPPGLTDAQSPRRDVQPEAEDYQDYFTNLFKHHAKQMGFVAKVDDCTVTNSSTLKEHLNTSPFLYVGYWFYVSEYGHVQVFCDLSRTMAQMVYPKGPHLDNTQLFRVLESIRMAGVVVNMGIPPIELVRTYEAMRIATVTLLHQALDILSRREEGIEFDASLKFDNFLDDNPLGPDLPNNIEGLLELLLFNTEELWLVPKRQDAKPAKQPPSKDERELPQSFNPFDDTDPRAIAVREAVATETVKPVAVQQALKQVASVARQERPPTQRTHGRPEPITTEAQVAERAETKKAFRQHEKAAAAAREANPFDQFGPDFDRAEQLEEQVAEEAEKSAPRDADDFMGPSYAETRAAEKGFGEDSDSSVHDSDMASVSSGDESVTYEEAAFGEKPRSHRRAIARAKR